MKTITFVPVGPPATRRQSLAALATGLVLVLNGLVGHVVGGDFPKSTIQQLTPGGFSPVPLITSVSNKSPTELRIDWFGLTPPYQVQRKTNLDGTAWSSAGPGTGGNSILVPRVGDFNVFRIRATAPNYVGAETCSQCHPDNHQHWSVTRHASALESLKRIGQGNQGSCLVCHTVGYGLDNGFMSEALTPHLAGVQCENCHGPGGNHAINPTIESLRPKVELSSKVCGGCHSDVHHPTYEEWDLAKHSIAVHTIKDSAFANDSCLQCHSEQYRYASRQGLTPPTKLTAQLSLECATCHSAHAPNVEIAQLRKPIAQLCGECHTAGQSVLGTSPHHPQFQVLSGYGSFREDGTILTNTLSTHSTLASGGGQACAQCHVVKHEVEDPDLENPNVTGHTFNPFDESIEEHQADAYTGCLDCHTRFVAHALHNFYQADMSARLTYLAPFFNPKSPSYIDPKLLTPADSNRLAVAKFNYQFINEDKSLGVHNGEFARESVLIASNIIRSLTMPMPAQP